MAQEPVPVGFLDGSLGPEDAISGNDWPVKDSIGEENALATEISSAARALDAVPGLAAARDGDVAALEALLTSGWRPNTQDTKGCTALMWAAGAGHLDVCEILVRHGADVNFSNKSGRTALQWAARNAQLEACEWLANRGADVDSLAKDGVNIFHWAVWGGSVPVCKWALSMGVNPHAVNRWGCSAIHWAGAAGDVGLCQFLKNEVRLDFGVCNNQGHDGLKKAAWNGHMKLCLWILEEAGEGARALLEATDRAGLTAAELADINKHRHVAERLRQLASGEADAPRDAESAPCLQLPSAEYTLYYRTQKVIRKEEWPSFVAAMHRQPPHTITARAAGGQLPAWLLPHAHLLDRSPWAGRTTWSVPARLFRANVELKQRLRTAMAAGMATTQDPSVLVPALLLGIQPHHSVLDIAASSAERPLQCLDLMAEKDASGVLFVNAMNAKTFICISGAAKRLQGASPLCIGTVGNGAKFPCTFQGSEQVLFDRVICEPPCSLDGTLREKPDLWASWTVGLGLASHNALFKLLLRSLHNLAPGGKLLYTVRSLNPIEAEAVVLGAMKRFKGAVELVACEPLEGLCVEPGLTTWSVPDPARTSNFRYFESWDQVPPELRAPKGVLRSTMFCDALDPMAAELGTKTVRLLPHRSDSNALFAAVLVKSAHTPAIYDEWVHKTVSKGGWPTWSRQYSQITAEHPLMQCISEFYGLEAETVQQWHLSYETHRHSTQIEDIKSIRLHSQLAHRLLLNTEPPLQPNGIHITGAGLPLFEPLRQNFLKDCRCRWFPSVEACALLRKVARRRVLVLGRIQFTDFIRRKRVPIPEFAAEFEQAGIEPDQVGGLLVHVDPPLKIDDELDVCIPGVMSNTELIAYAGSAVLDGLLME